MPLTLGGKYFDADIKVRLTRGGDAISADEVVFVTPTDAEKTRFDSKIRATFDLSNAEVGVWTVDVTNPDGGYDRLKDSFTLDPAAATDPIITVIHPDAYGPGAPTVLHRWERIA